MPPRLQQRQDLRGARAHLDELSAINTTRGKTTASGYSLAALIRSRLTDPSLDIRPDEGQHEKRVSDAIRASIREPHRSPNFYLPIEGLRPQAGVTTGTWRGGGALTARRLDLGEVLRPELALQRLGARRIDLEAGWSGRATVSPAKLTAGWSDPATGVMQPATEMNLSLTSARTREVTVEVECSRLLLKQTNAEALVRELFAAACEEEYERAAIDGSGRDGQPMGLTAVAEVGVMQNQPVAGSLPSYGELVGGLQLALDAGARLRRCGFLLSQADHDALVALERPGGHPALVEGVDGWSLAGRPCEFSAFVPSGQAFAGEFGECELVWQSVPTLLINPYTKSNQSIIKISIFDLFDFVIRRPQFITAIR